MGTISRSGITNGNTIQPSHITNIIDALDGTSATTTVVATGSFTGSLVGALTGTASFATTALSASYAANVPVTASYALAALSASFATTASYALNAGGGTGVGFPFTGSAQVTGSMGITGSLNVTAGVTASLQGTASFADTADQLLVSRTLIDGSFFPVIADSANATSTPERLKTTSGITINPSTNVIAGATVTGSAHITGSLSATKFADVDLSVIGSASGTGQFNVPITQTSGTPRSGSLYWNDVTNTLYIYSATNAAWYNIPLNP